LRISSAGKHARIIRNKTVKPGKRQCLPYYRSDKGFKGTVVNLALSSFHGGSLATSLITPFKCNFEKAAVSHLYSTIYRNSINRYN